MKHRFRRVLRNVQLLMNGTAISFATDMGTGEREAGERTHPGGFPEETYSAGGSPGTAYPEGAYPENAVPDVPDEEEMLENGTKLRDWLSSIENSGKRNNDRQRRKGKNDSVRNQLPAGLIAEIPNEGTRDYIENRLIPQMEYYSKRSSRCKGQYFWLMGAAIVLGSLIPVFSVFSHAQTPIKVLIAALGTGVTAINAFLALLNSKELWISYRVTEEKLMRTLYAYLNHADGFSRDLTQEERDVLLFQICEDEMAGEHSGWQEAVKKDE